MLPTHRIQGLTLLLPLRGHRLKMGLHRPVKSVEPSADHGIGAASLRWGRVPSCDEEDDADEERLPSQRDDQNG